MNQQHEDVDVFHAKMGIKAQLPTTPRLLPEDQLAFREQFLIEELEEFMTAHQEGNLVQAFDALLDLAYVVHGTALYMGIDPARWQAGWDAVQQANMAKRAAASAAESKRGHVLDVVKPAGWVGPEAVLAALVRP